jgi:N-acetyl-anhydromuramyl-L-alanine amidase AmpD
MMLPDIYKGAQKLVTPLAMSAGPMLDVEGVTVHHTADTNVTRLIESLKGEGLGYHIIIDRDGTVIQTTYHSQRVNHAGTAKWLGHSPNRSHIAVALVSWGSVTKKGNRYFAWNGAEVVATQVANRRGNLTDHAYYWHAATPQQEAALEMYLRWCMTRGLSRESFCGHDECALPKGRKSDPGGVLSMTMADLRAKLGQKAGN